MSSVAPQKLMRRVERSEDRFELRVVWVDDDVGGVETEPLPPSRLEPIRAFRADQGDDAARRSRPLEFKDFARIGSNAGARHGHLENPPSLDLELRKDSRMNGLGLADGVPELRFELIYHRPEQSTTEPPGSLRVAEGGRLAFTGGDRSQVLGWQPSNIIQAVALPAGRSRGSSLEVIHF